VVTDHPPDHGSYDELAAGYVLDALEPADEQRYLRHTEHCAACAQTLAGFREVAAALADTATPAEPRPQLADRIMAAALADLEAGHRPGARPADSVPPASPPPLLGPVAGPRAPGGPAPEDQASPAPRDAATTPGDAATTPGDSAATPGDAAATPGDAAATPGDFASPGDAAATRGDSAAGAGDASGGPADSAATPGDALPPGVVPLRPRTRRWLRPVTAAAAAALIAAGGIWAGLAGTANNSAPPVANCAHVRGCTEITLTAAATHRPVARLIITNDTAWMVPAAMKADDTADQIYVLWQITGSHRPLAVGSFDVRPGARGPIRIGSLAASLPGTLAFAVSLEHGRAIPPGPSRIAALGQVT
jgi:anti-sigma-K factor RskA